MRFVVTAVKSDTTDDVHSGAECHSIHRTSVVPQTQTLPNILLQFIYFPLKNLYFTVMCVHSYSFIVSTFFSFVEVADKQPKEKLRDF